MFQRAAIPLAMVLSTAPVTATELWSAADVDALCSMSDPLWAQTLAWSTDEGLFRAACDRVEAVGASCNAAAMRSVASSWTYAAARAGVLADVYQVEVPSSAFVVLPWDEHTGVTVVPMDAGLEVFDRFVLRSRSGEPLPFVVDASAAEEVEQLHGMDDLGLVLAFELDTLRVPRMEMCTAGEEGLTVIRVEAVQAQLTQRSTRRIISTASLGGAASARIRTGEADLVSAGDIAVPWARIVSMHSECRLHPLDDETAWLSLALETHLSTCYLEALADNSGLAGAMTLELNLNPDGVAGTEVMIDAVGSPQLQRCLMETLPMMELPSGLIGEDVRVRVNAFFDAQ